MDFASLLDSIAAEARPLAAAGKLADYIPALADVDPHRFGLALVTTEGEAIGSGDWREPFSVQSLVKLFVLALVLAEDDETIWNKVGREPSGNPFNSLVQLEVEQGIPRNPFINAGALVLVDRLMEIRGDAVAAVLAFLRTEGGNPGIRVDEQVARSEAAHGHRNAALAHFIASYGNIRNSVDEVLEQYFRLCSVAMSCEDLARAGCFLARHGLRADGTRMLSRSQAKRINAVLLTCGTYDAAGDFAYRVGLPAKSGVGGGILGILPERGCICVWSPPLDAKGNSLAGVEALDRFTTRTGWSVF